MLSKTSTFAIKEAIESEFDWLEKMRILEKVEHAQWVAPIVPVPKGNGQFRICEDYKSTINDALEIDFQDQMTCL